MAPSSRLQFPCPQFSPKSVPSCPLSGTRLMSALVSCYRGELIGLYLSRMITDRTPGRFAPLKMDTRVRNDFSDALPGGDIVRLGLADLAAGRTSEESLLVLIGAPRLRRLGFVIPDTGTPDPDLELYSRLSAKAPDAAHSRYNALIRLLVSFERAVESGG